MQLWRKKETIMFMNVIRMLKKSFHGCLLSLQIPVDAPWNAPRAKEWDSISAKEFFDKVVWTKYVCFCVGFSENGMFSQQLEF